ncbi:MAG: hypothetical protein IJF02_07405 [Oscillospiraceae bacterium]|nr:hypothetical protein [Oscillospiraceae bacterium]
MEFALPKLGKEAICFPHFPTLHQAFIFRAYEYVPVAKIAAVLGTTEENVLKAAQDMGLMRPCTTDIWLKKGYITIIRSLWHILPYEQLLILLDMDAPTLARILREEDFLDIKLKDKPVCVPVVWRELTQKEAVQTEVIRSIMQTVDTSGIEPFDFKYNMEPLRFSGEENFGTRLVYGFSGLYQNALDVDSETFCQDEMLEAYQKVGINALWFPGALHSLYPNPFEPSLSEGYEQRLERFRRFSERCEKYGIKLFLYLNEPRNMPSAFFEKHPHIRGHERDETHICLCTSTKEVQNYLTDGVEFVCRNVPKIGGIFTITRSENLTNCYSHSQPHNCNCPRCSKRSVGEVIGEVMACIEKGAHKVSPDIKVIAWSWAWADFNLEIIEHLPQDVIFMCNSETLIPFKRGGIDTEVQDYSMSEVGPGERALIEWNAAKNRGLEIAAKIQVNTTWECSTVPAVPVYPLVEEHIRRLKEQGITNLMLSWTLGGYPSHNLQHAAKYFYEHFETASGAPLETPAEQKATELFSEAFQEFPFHIHVLYFGPQNAGVSNLLYLTPTGYEATMTCYAYDDLEKWRQVYPVDIFENQFAKLCGKWEEGLALLTDNGSELWIMANAAYCQFRSSLNQIRFYRARQAGSKLAMKESAENELALTHKMLNLMNRDAAIGFEAANHYYFSKGNLAEKILNCHNVIRELSK